MLTAAIVYLCGSGGQFLNRVLALSEKTIPMVKNNDNNINQPTLQIDAQSRFELYNCFDPSDWRTSEFSLVYQYRWGRNDFFNYENSRMSFIDSWHPHVFVSEEDNGLWPYDKWPMVILIECDHDDIKFLNAQSKNKLYFPNTKAHCHAMETVKQRYQHKIFKIPFKSFLNQDTFIPYVQQINKLLDLDLDFVLVEKLYDNWITQSLCCWNNDVDILPQNIYKNFWEN